MLIRWITLIATISLSFWATSTWAQWTLDNDRSRLSFISTKAGDIAEVHYFKNLSGTLLESGDAQVSVKLASVETLIPIRNQRMKTFLFQSDIFPEATLRTNVDPLILSGFNAGDTLLFNTDATLTLKDKTIPINLNTLVAKLDGETLVISSLVPIILTAQDTGLTQGIEKLRSLAGLPSISQSVPVSFVLTFRKHSP